MALSILPNPGLDARAYVPNPALRGFVRGYWSVDVREPPQAAHLVADGLVDLTFDLERARAFVTGVSDAPASYVHERRARLFGASFEPGAVPLLLGVPATTLTPQWTPLESVIGDPAAPFATLVAEAGSMEIRLAIVDAFFLARVVAGDADPRVRKALDAIVASEGATELPELGRASGASPRNLGRLFEEWVGLTPKRFSRIVRIQAAIRVLEEHPDASLAAVATELGFADQGHLAREMQALAGVTPSVLVRKLSDSSKS